MATPYAGNPVGVVSANYTLPDDGDAADAASVDVPFEGIADDIARLNVTRITPAVMACRHFTSNLPGAAVWSHNSGAWEWITSDPSAKLFGEVDLPNGCEITAVTLFVKGASGHSAFPGGKPSTMPNFQLHKLALSTFTPSTIGALVSDPSSSAAGYEGAHNFNATGYTEIVDNAGHIYWVEITPEAGTNFIAGGFIVGATVGFTPTTGRAP